MALRGGSRAGAREAGRSHRALRLAICPVAPGISPRKSKEGLGKRRRFGGGCVRYTVITNPYTFTGRRLDDETGLFYYRNRNYHAQLGRFVTRDPIGYHESGTNLYEYVWANPTNAVDPYGLVASTTSSTGTPTKKSCYADWKKCDSDCLKKHGGWVVGTDLLDCYDDCDAKNTVCKDKVLCNVVGSSPKCPGCGGQDCMDTLKKIRDVAKRVPKPRCLRNRCQQWALDAAYDVFPKNGINNSNPCIFQVRCTYFRWFVSGGHAAVEITLCDGSIVYADWGTTGIGGKDHYGIQDDIPPWLW